jgi:hypothetical protein
MEYVIGNDDYDDNYDYYSPEFYPDAPEYEAVYGEDDYDDYDNESEYAELYDALDEEEEEYEDYFG